MLLEIPSMHKVGVLPNKRTDSSSSEVASKTKKNIYACSIINDLTHAKSVNLRQLIHSFIQADNKHADLEAIAQTYAFQIKVMIINFIPLKQRYSDHKCQNITI